MEKRKRKNIFVNFYLSRAYIFCAAGIRHSWSKWSTLQQPSSSHPCSYACACTIVPRFVDPFKRIATSRISRVYATPRDGSSWWLEANLNLNQQKRQHFRVYVQVYVYVYVYVYSVYNPEGKPQKRATKLLGLCTEFLIYFN